MSSLEIDKTYKIVIIGDSQVGKTCILRRYINNDFTTSTFSTIGVAFASKTLSINNTRVSLNILDTAGQEMFRSITPTYYRQAIGAFIVFDVSDRKTFNNIEFWMKDMYSNIDKRKVVTLLIGNKIDLDRQVSYEEANAMATRKGVPYIETSALDNTNIVLAFEQLTRMILEARNSFVGDTEAESPNMGGKKIPERIVGGKKHKNSCCCGRDATV